MILYYFSIFNFLAERFTYGPENPLHGPVWENVRSRGPRLAERHRRRPTQRPARRVPAPNFTRIRANEGGGEIARVAPIPPFRFHAITRACVPVCACARSGGESGASVGQEGSRQQSSRGGGALRATVVDRRRRRQAGWTNGGRYSRCNMFARRWTARDRVTADGVCVRETGPPRRPTDFPIALTSPLGEER